MHGLRALAIAVVAVALAPGAASAASLDHVTMYSDGDYIGGGQQRFYFPGNGEITVGGSTSYLTVGVSGGSLGDAYSLEFAAPPGEVLVPGVYDKAQRAAFREAGRPGIDIGGDGRGCNEVSGRFEVKDFAVTADGRLERLWIVYEHHCEGGTAGLFGEVRLGEPGPAGPVATAPSIVRWPALDRGGAGAAVPVKVLATSASQMGAATLAGDAAGDFAIRLDECAGQSLPAGGMCDVWVRFRPATAGTRTAVLRIPEDGRVHEIALQGFAYGGRTGVHMDSDAGDYIGQGQTWDYTPANASIAAGGSRQYVSFGLDGANGDWWYADFTAGQGDILVPGSTYSATRYPFNGTGPGMSVDGQGRGCNELSGSFTVTDLRFEQDGRLRGVGIRFEQHCEHATAALRGTWELRAGDTTPLPPWMVAGPGSVGPGVELGGPSPPPAPPAPAAPAAPPAGGPGASPGGSPAVPCTETASLPLRRGTRGRDRLLGTRRAERILARAGGDRVRARAGGDCVDGGPGNDVLLGDGGADTLFGGTGADRLFGGTGGDTLFGGIGDDRLFGGPGGDALHGASGRDALYGGSGADTLHGEGGDDVLIGGRGRDQLACGAGRRDAARAVQAGDSVTGCERIARVRPRPRRPGSSH
jgi:Ca2+-binding RTX toxin-like protein